MDKACFKDIMEQTFIPYVVRKRQKIDRIVSRLKEKIERGEATCQDRENLKRFSAISKHAVLVVDGHKSRYDFDTLAMLRAYDIDFIILAAHSSHLTQPLDLRLNGLVKQEFRAKFTKKLPPELEETLKRKPAKIARTSDENQPLNADSEVVKAEYDRLHVMNAIRNAIPRALTPDNIMSAWRASHLYPFKEEPPYSIEEEERFRREISASAIQVNINRVQETDGRLTGLINKSITGVINSSSNLPAMSQLLAQDLVPETCNGVCTVVVSDGPLTAIVETSNENDDVGDSVQILPGGADGTSGQISGVSDAPFFVSFDERDL